MAVITLPKQPHALGVGGSGIAAFRKPQSAADAQATLQAHWDIGVRYFDTAPLYGIGLSERRIGDFLRDKTDHYVLSTKVGRLLRRDAPAYGGSNWAQPLPFGLAYDYSYDGVMRSYEDSLQRLGLGRIDILFLHDIDRMQHGVEADYQIGNALSGGIKALGELKQSGAINGFGLGVNRTEIVAEFLQHTDLDVVLLAGRYSLLDQSADAEAFPLMASRGVQVVLGGIFNSGILAGGSTFDYGQADAAVLGKVALIKDAATRHGITMPAAALQFAMAHPIVEAVLNSASSPASVANTLAMAAMPIPADFWQEMRMQGIILPTSPTPKPR